jgi:hypothetical protein
MLCIRADRVARFAAGAAFLLLLVAEAKVCPWLLLLPVAQETPHAEADGSDGAAAPGAEGGEPAEPAEKRAVNLAAWLPDVMPVRWPTHCSRVAHQELVGPRDGTVACGPLRPCGVQTYPAGAADAAPSWRAPLGLLPDPVLRPAQAGCQQIQDPAISIFLQRTGPPAA